jgi:hypothetical protein
MLEESIRTVALSAWYAVPGKQTGGTRGRAADISRGQVETVSGCRTIASALLQGGEERLGLGESGPDQSSGRPGEVNMPLPNMVTRLSCMRPAGTATERQPGGVSVRLNQDRRRTANAWTCSL